MTDICRVSDELPLVIDDSDSLSVALLIIRVNPGEGGSLMAEYPSNLQMSQDHVTRVVRLVTAGSKSSLAGKFFHHVFISFY